MKRHLNTCESVSPVVRASRVALMVMVVSLGLLTVSCPVRPDLSGGPRVPQGEGQLGFTGGEDEIFVAGADPADADGADAGEGDLVDQVNLGVEVPLDGAPLETFFRSLERVEGGAREVVRVAHYGDSHTAADFITSAIRRPLQDRFGDGGRGFVLLGKPWRSYRPRDAAIGATGEWTMERIRIAVDRALLDGRYGYAGVSVESEEEGATASVETVDGTGYGESVSSFDVYYLLQPEGGSFEVLVDGEVVASASTHGRQFKSGFLAVEVEEGAHELKIRVSGDGPVRLFGVALENDGPGISYDSLGVNGGFFYTPLRWDADVLFEQVERRDPQLIVAMYGSNEADSRTINQESYKEMVMDAMARFRKGAPEASCLLLGPPDRRFKALKDQRQEQLTWIIDVQREVADELGCAFLDLREMMGGPGSQELWSQMSPSMAQPDGVHLTVRGYEHLGAQVAQQLIDAYDEYREE